MALRDDIARLMGRFEAHPEFPELVDAIDAGNQPRARGVLREMWADVAPRMLRGFDASFVAVTARWYTVEWNRLPTDEIALPTGAFERAQRQAARRVTLMTSQSRSVIRRLVAAAVAGGKGYEPLASRMVANGLGMDRIRAGAHAKVFDRLTVDLAKKVITPKQARSRLARDKARKIRSRARTIARTELADAREAARQRAWSDARRRGIVNDADWEKVWHTSNDEFVDEVCVPLDGATTTPTGTFFDGTARPPKHPNCRCTMSLRRKR